MRVYTTFGLISPQFVFRSDEASHADGDTGVDEQGVGDDDGHDDGDGGGDSGGGHGNYRLTIMTIMPMGMMLVAIAVMMVMMSVVAMVTVICRW